MINYVVQQLPAHLFWDSDPSKLDDVEHHEKIIVRTFERGDLEDMALVMAYYGDAICREVLIQAPALQESAMIFGKNFLGIPDEAFAANKMPQRFSI